MTFWPERAHEWTALIAGTLGALLGTLSFVVALMSYRRDRAKLRFTVRREYIGELPEDHPFYDTDMAFSIQLRVTNIGRRPVIVESAWFRIAGSDHWAFLKPVHPRPLDPPELLTNEPVLLSENSPTMVFATMHTAVEFRDVFYFEVYDAAFRRYRLYKPNRVVALYRHIVAIFANRKYKRQLLERWTEHRPPSPNIQP